MADKGLVNVGEVSGVFGIKGWVKVFSFTDPRDNILSYSPWLLSKGNETKTVKVIEGTLQGGAVVAKLVGIDDRDQAAALMGWTIFITPEQLPKTAADEYYWSDLLGLNVETTDGVSLGVVDSLLETGANDVVVVSGERPRAIPFLQGQTIIRIDLAAQLMVVDWDPDF
ncbi:ribosome maturation factor RimM [Methylovulum psychrotolerans]|uniref:Ribosome maturation factor RimM n=1 Tax=Methylovulum psychrotolerans TaxID=1704499 RepID=A0A1Z4BWW6_9GAMM|nr:ribosome maturation factor RimM [Methylovulum psychrotolerans]ASF45796.1 ribosome maturation factor RimM [Methylovulum psychrotolerans]